MSGRHSIGRVIECYVGGLLPALCLLFTIFGLPEVGRAQSEQLYFVGVEARLGSLSGEGGMTTGVFLRWDPVEGSVPSDVAFFRVERDGVALGGPLPGHSVMSASNIVDLYSGASQSRRRAEVVHSLNENAAGQHARAVLDGEPAPPCFPTGVTTANFGSVIRSLVDPANVCFDSFWALMASRQDFNVARARNRAYLDAEALAPGTYEYTLVAISAGADEAVVGRIDVVVDGSPDVLAGAVDFEMRPQARCDGPERFKDHGSVALYWNFPGANLTERLRDALMTAGFDLYRSDQVTTGLTGDDLRGLAQASAHDATGEFDLPGLVRVNPRPIAISGAPEAGADGVQRDTRYEGWNPPFVQYVESPESLAAAGVLPGEWRNYYLVARDVTGSYGDTVEIRVQIPDTIAPPAPWDVRTEIDSYDDSLPGLTGSLEVVWDHVDTRNYHNDHANERSYCNLDTARFDEKLVYAPAGASCEDSALQEVELDVRQYIVYRFDSPANAQAFADSDGDGRSDDVERIQLTGPPQRLTDPGTACDPDDWPGPALDYRVSVDSAFPPAQVIDLVTGPGPMASWGVETAPDGRKVIRWRDTDVNGPAGLDHAGEVFWYTLVAVDEEGNLSPLSAPVRAHFPDRSRPDRAGIDCGRPAECETWADRLTSYDSGLPFALDATQSGRADFVRVGCDSPDGVAQLYEVEYRIEDLGDGVRGVLYDAQSCEELVENCLGAGPGYVEFHNDSGTLLDSDALPYTAEYPEGFNQCPIPNARLQEDCEGTPLLPLRPGEALEEAPVCRPRQDATNECISVYRRLGDRSLRWKTFCDLSEFTLDVPSVGSEPICLSLTLHNQNNVTSAHLRLPCFTLPSNEPIDTPQPLGISFSGDRATLSWLPPQQELVGTLLQWWRSGGEEAATYFHPHTGKRASHGTIAYDGVEIGPAPLPGDSEQEWCFRARSVGPDKASGSSSWSPQICDLRLPPGESYPDYLPWPAIQAPGPLGKLEATYFPKEGLPAVLIADSLTLNLGASSSIPTECLGKLPGTGFDEACLQGLDDAIDGIGGSFCSVLRNVAAPRLGFVAYRQSRTDSLDTPSEFQQVSPLVDRIHCWEHSDDQAIFGHLEDPMLKLVSFSSQASFHPGEVSLVFIDRTPHEVGREYRYQFVYFDQDGEIAGHRSTDWLVSTEGL